MKVVRGWVPVVLAGMLGIVGTGRVEASTSSTPIAYTDGGILRLVDADGRHRVETGVSPGYLTDLEWARDGKHLAYVRSEPLGTMNTAFDEIVVSDATLSRTRVVLHEPGLFHSEPTFSPDGKRIAYIVGYPAGYFGIGYQAHVWVMNADGTDRRLVAALPGAAQWLDWAPTGGRLAFGVDGMESGAGLAVVDIDVDVPTPRIITPPDMLAVRGPTWSPDGKRIAFGGARVDILTNQLYVVNPDGTGLDQVSDKSVGYFLCVPVWSPTGRSIAFSTDDLEVMVVHADGSAARRVGNGWSPTWAPDAHALAFVHRPSNGRGELRVVDLRSGEYRSLGAVDREAAWAPA